MGGLRIFDWEVINTIAIFECTTSVNTRRANVPVQRTYCNYSISVKMPSDDRRKNTMLISMMQPFPLSGDSSKRLYIILPAGMSAQ